MAELTFKSAGVATREIDLTGPTSVRPQGIPAGIIGTAEKGPAFVPVTVATFQDFLAEFGATDGERFGPLAMNEWMRYARAGTYVRVLGCGDAKKRTTTGAVTNAGFIVGDQQVQGDGKLGNNPNASNTGEGGAAAVVLTAATADITVLDHTDIRTGDGAILSNGVDSGSGGIFPQSLVRGTLHGQTITVNLASGPATFLGRKDGDPLVNNHTIRFHNNATVAGESPGDFEVVVNVGDSVGGTFDAGSLAVIQDRIIECFQRKGNGQYTDTHVALGMTYAQTFNFGAQWQLATAAGGAQGDIASVFIASDNGNGVKVEARGSQTGTADDGTTYATGRGVYGGANISGAGVWKITPTAQLAGGASAVDGTVTAGDADGATTIVLTAVGGGPLIGTLTANGTVSSATARGFLVSGEPVAGTAITATAANLNTAANALTTWSSAIVGDKVTVTNNTDSGAAGNSATAVVSNEDSGAFTVVDFSRGLDQSDVDHPNLTPKGRAYFLGALMKDSSTDTTWLKDTSQPDGAGASTDDAMPIIRGMVHAASGVVLSLSCSVAAVENNQPATNAAGTFGTGDDDGGNTWGSVETANSKQEFVMILNGFTKSDLYTNVITASFDPQSPSYFANTFNTDPTKAEEAGHYLHTHYDVRTQIGIVTGSGVTTEGHEKDGDSSVTVAAFMVTSSLGRNAGSATVPNFEAFTDRYRTAVSPAIVSQAFGGSRHNLFTFHALDDGAYPNNKVKLTFENIQRSTNDSTDFGSFDVLVRRFTDDDNNRVSYEKFRKMDLNPQSERYIGRVIGDKNTYYDFDKNSGAQKLVVEGVHPNNSKWIRVKMSADVTDGVVPETCLPVGFRGPRHLVTSGSSIISSPSLTGVVAGGGELNRLIEPPIPYRDNLTTGKTQGKKKVDSSFCWGVQFELKDDLDERNKNTKTDAGLSAYTAYYPHWHTSDQKSWEGSNEGKADATGTVFDSDRFNNNLFTLERVQVLTQSNDTPDPKQWVAAEYRRDGVSKANLTDKDGTPSTSTRFLNVAKDFGHLPTRKYLKFSLFLQGGFNGVNIYNEDRAKLLNAAAKREMDDAANQGGTAGNTVASYRKAIDVMEERADVDIKILAIPGLRHKSVSDYAIDAVEDRFDAMYIMDIEERDQIDNVVTSSVDSTTSVSNTITAFSNRNLDTSFAAAYFPDVIVTDPVTRANVQCAPSVGVIGAFSLNDSVAHPWFAPAGFTRGAMSNVVESQVKLNRANLDELYEADINPITAFPHTPGVVVFGQKTLLAGQSALDRVNVRRLLIDVRRKVRSVANTILFEPNREETLARFSSAVTPILTRIQQQQGLDRFKVVIDTTTTSQADVENNTIRGKIFLQPTRAVEFISLDFVVTNAGAEI
jgi:phage tail sheath protein FI